MLLGRELRRGRHAAALTQEALAARAKVDRTYLSDLENDKVSPTVDMLERICAVLGIRVSALIAQAETAQSAPHDDEAVAE